MGPVIKIIHDAYNIIKNPERWCQGFYQKDKNGKHCSWAEGYSFCALGALNFVCCDGDEDYQHKAQCLLQRVSESLFGCAIQNVNDRMNGEAHKNVLLVYQTILNTWRDREPTEEECLNGVSKDFLKLPQL